MRIIRCENYKEASEKAAAVIASQVIQKPDCVLGLATGSTPLGTYANLAKWCDEGLVDFSKVMSFNLDEYMGLSPEHDQSYHYFMKHNLFDKINIDQSRTFVPDGLAEDPSSVGEAYDAHIASEGGIDLQLLGIGRNGHIGFNEPCDEFVAPTHLVTLKENTREANARFFTSIDEVPTQAITMGMKSIMQARKVLLMACGPDKMEILKAALEGPVTPQVPASILQLHKDLVVVYCERGQDEA